MRKQIKRTMQIEAMKMWQTDTTAKRSRFHSQHLSFTVSQLCDLRFGAHLRLHVSQPAVSCRHSSIMWAADHTSPTYCCYLHGIYAGTKLYCLVTVARVSIVRYLMVEWLGVEPATFCSVVQCHNRYTTKPHKPDSTASYNTEMQTTGSSWGQSLVGRCRSDVWQCTQ